MKRQPRVEYYQDKGGFWRWRTVAANGRILGESSEGYARRGDCERGAHISCNAILATLQVPSSKAIN